MSRELTLRERWALAIGGVAVLLTLVTFGIIVPYRQALQRLDTRIASSQRQMNDIESLLQQYRQLKSAADRIERQAGKAGDFSLISFVETTAAGIGARDRLVYLRPQPLTGDDTLLRESVEVKLERLALDQLVRLLYAVENSRGTLQTAQLRIKTRFDDPSRLDVVLTLNSYGRSS
ncbi:hypothetical protein C2E25_10385 [Geothermobacter hydrogeniphilus]|uniref:General secretion pathway protein M n=1 Tax=Geothermobacter hydrogeniphilus TaxID=1969733 RepID=A0A2K2H994_9BACT|nr:type II secretion system protein GspM [Geothermobacter hydrogeniphilus]PNU19831.1 hypothetical protein C2E25_10385 [Geothermobacter hydrogeniphilus]